MDAARILAHRGLWGKPEEKNSLAALGRALDCGFGLELDLRDRIGEIVISHDPPGKDSVPFATFLKMHRNHPSLRKVFFALNVKSDGIEKEVIRIADRSGISTNSFVFDMSTPSKYFFHKQKIQSRTRLMIATRQSEFEAPLFYDNSDVVWLDGFESDWYAPKDVERHLAANKLVALVSPELHGRPYQKLWGQFKPFFAKSSKMLICTDKPAEFQAFVGD
jgi:glycerophosphoryl diester phosphodiesterase